MCFLVHFIQIDPISMHIAKVSSPYSLFVSFLGGLKAFLLVNNLAEASSVSRDGTTLYSEPLKPFGTSTQSAISATIMFYS